MVQFLRRMQVLRECGLFEVGALAREGKGGWSSVVELRWVRDEVAEIFVRKVLSDSTPNFHSLRPRSAVMLALT
jgi:hypothetical protein